MRRVQTALLGCLLTVLVVPALAGTLPRPPELAPAVDFWTRVYSEVSSDAGLLHDRRNLRVVYETVELERKIKRSRRIERVRERRRHYRDILQTLASGKRENLTAEERRVLDLWPEDVSNATLRRAAGEIRFQLGQADRFRRGLVRGGAWEPQIRRTLDEMGLPRELAALPHVESSFNPDAYSRLGAAGIWQFTRATGRRFLRVDHIVDERMDPFASTVAAARLLEHNHSVTGDWALAITAYNHGLAGIRRAARATGSDNIADIIREHEGRNWGFASRNFYPAFLAAVDVDFNAREHFGTIDRAEPIRSETVEMPFYAAVGDIIDAFGVDRSELRRLNRALRPPVWNGEKLVPRGYDLRVPSGPDQRAPREALARIESGKRFYAQLPDRNHTVSRGESLSTIAQRYGVSTTELVSINNLPSADFVRVGQKLRLPVADSAKPISSDIYIVQRGDSLSRIAQRTGMSVQALASANGIDPGQPIHPGDELRVDGGSVAGSGDRIAAADSGDAGEADDDASAGTAGQETGAAGEPADSAAATDAGQAAEELAVAEMTTIEDRLAAIVPAGMSAGTPADRDSVEATERDGPRSALAAAAPGGRQEDDSPREDDSLAHTRNELAADPSDYSVADDGTIEVQAAETLGHYAEWLDLRASGLRELNDMSFGMPVIIGHRVRLDFDRVARAEFEHRRRAYHEALQARFFDRFRITGTEEQEIQRGDSLWTLALRHDNIPVWLLRQYNPDLDFDHLRPGMPVNLPRVERQAGPEDEDGTLAADDT